MSVNTTPQAEERAARDRLRAIQHARAAKAKADARRRAAVIREELARPRAKDCHCPITADSTARGSDRTRRRVHRRPVGLPHARRDPAEARAMSATKPAGDSPRPILAAAHAQRDQTPSARRCRERPGSAPGRRRAGLTESPTRNQPTCPNPHTITTRQPRRWWESFQRAERARAGRLRSLWQMTPSSASPRCAAAN